MSILPFILMKEAQDQGILICCSNKTTSLQEIKRCWATHAMEIEYHDILQETSLFSTFICNIDLSNMNLQIHIEGSDVLTFHPIFILYFCIITNKIIRQTDNPKDVYLLMMCHKWWMLKCQEGINIQYDMYLSIYAIETICSGIKKKLKDVIWAMTHW